MLCFLTLEDTTDGRLRFGVMTTGCSFSFKASRVLAVKLGFLWLNLTFFIRVSSDTDNFDNLTTLGPALRDFVEGFLLETLLEDFSKGEETDLVERPTTGLVEMRRIGTMRGLFGPGLSGDDPT